MKSRLYLLYKWVCYCARCRGTITKKIYPPKIKHPVRVSHRNKKESGGSKIFPVSFVAFLLSVFVKNPQ